MVSAHCAEVPRSMQIRSHGRRPAEELEQYRTWVTFDFQVHFAQNVFRAFACVDGAQECTYANALRPNRQTFKNLGLRWRTFTLRSRAYHAQKDTRPLPRQLTEMGFAQLMNVPV